MDIAQLLAFGVKQGASDLHLSAGLPPMIRVDGDIRRINVPEMDHKQVHDMLYDIMSDKQRKDYEEFLETDFSFEIPGLARFRVNAFNHNRGAGGVFRTIPSKILTLEDLDAPAIFRDISEYPRGIVLVTGPTGSGKSTTLAAMIDYKNDNEYGHPDCRGPDRIRPPEQEMPGQPARGAPRHPGLQRGPALRPARGSGHHPGRRAARSRDHPPGADRGRDRSLRAVISQTLLKKIGGGRIAAHEIMIGTPAIRNLIREDKIAQMYSAIQTGQGLGMQTLDQNLKALLAKGVVSKEEARRKAVTPDAL